MPTFRQLLRLQYPTVAPEDIQKWLKWVATLEAKEMEAKKHAAGLEARKRDILTLYNALDTDGKGTIDEEEFLLLRGKSAGELD